MPFLRFTDPHKWQDEWWGSLPNDYRIVWLYLVDSCSWAGLWKKDMRGLNFNCNTKITEEELVKFTAGRLIDCGKFYFIPAFIKFQNPTGIQSNKPVVRGIRKELSEHNLWPIVRQSLGNDYVTIQGNGKGTREKEEIEEGIGLEREGDSDLRKDFEDAQRAYPGRTGKVASDFAVLEQRSDWREVIPKLLPAIELQIRWREQANGEFRAPWKDFRNWLDKEGWEEKVKIPEPEKVIL